MRMLFVHGAGGFDVDRPLADALGSRLRARVDMPRLPGDDMSVATWALPVRRQLAELGGDDVVIGHSFGATVLQWVLGEQAWEPGRALLLAMPDWSPAGWDVDQYLHRGPEPAAAVSLHHCRDDEVVPFDHLALNATRMPSAGAVGHPSGGHQFDGLVEVLAADVLHGADPA